MKYSLLTAAIILTSFFSNAQTKAFPTAEGFGAFATGGRGGSVYHVTNLNDSGTGSFRDAVSKPIRTVVFDVSGVIKIINKISASPNITIAGQTAPGNGVVIYGNGISFHDSSIIRHMTFRGSITMPRGACVVVIDDCKDVIFDHVTVEWGRWDNLHMKNSSNISMQYCMIGQGILPQKFGALFEGPTNVTIHHSLWIDNQSRNPKAKAGIEYINNVVYNWGSSGFVGGHSAAHHYQDLINNYFIAGPSSSKNFLSLFDTTDHVYHKGNMVDMNKDGSLNGRAVDDTDFVSVKASLVAKPNQHSTVQVTVDAPELAYKKVLAEAGSFLHRDAVDLNLLAELSSLGTKGKVITEEKEAGGQPEIAQVNGLKDTDNDGIPDEWELKMKLNSKDAKDAQQIGKNGYTNLEKYLNELLLKETVKP